MSADGISLSTVLLLDIVLAVVAMLATACLTKVTPLLAVLPLFLWGVGLYLDISSTRDIYRLDPESFRWKELNKIIAGLVDRLGFTAGAVLYVFLWEIPVFVFFSLFFLRFVTPFSSLLPSLASRLGGGAAGMGVIHATAWHLNRRFLEERG